MRRCFGAGYGSCNPPLLLTPQGRKYARRWVELAVHTLCYAKTHTDIAAGNIEVFAMHELMSVRKEGTSKFTVSTRRQAGGVVLAWPTRAAVRRHPAPEMGGLRWCLSSSAGVCCRRAGRSPPGAGRHERTPHAPHCTLQLKFPERYLEFKVENGSELERDRWVATVQNARDDALSAQGAAAQGGHRLLQLKKQAEDALLDDPASSGSPRITARSSHSSDGACSRASSRGASAADSRWAPGAPGTHMLHPAGWCSHAYSRPEPPGLKPP
jgi:hypothetical protein